MANLVPQEASISPQTPPGHGLMVSIDLGKASSSPQARLGVA
jgi:hypothetical protein